MPLIPVAMSSLMVAEGSSLSMTGSKFSTMVLGISTAASMYVMASAVVTSTNVVLGAGAGTFTGKIVGLSAVGMATLMQLQASAMQVNGKDLFKLFSAVSFGVVMSLNTVMAQGTVAGGGPGMGTGRITALVPMALQPLIMAQLSAVSITGQKMGVLALAMANGICIHIMTAATIPTICIGSFTTPPVGPVTLPTAPGFGRLV